MIAPSIKHYLATYDYTDASNEVRVGIAAMKVGNTERKLGNLTEAAEAYDRAVTCLLESGLAWHQDQVLAKAVARLTESARTKARNCRHPVVKRKPASTQAPPCLCCRKKLRRYKHDGRMFHGQPAEWGDYGDNTFCGVACAARWARWAIGSGAVQPRRRIA